MSASIKQKLGSLLYDLPGYAELMWMSRRGVQQTSWVFIHNRDERLEIDPQRIGARCKWKWTTDLHIAKVFPRLGRELMRTAITDWPIVVDKSSPALKEGVMVSFIIGHRGRSRVQHLLTTIRSIATQRDVSFECIVVEQSNEPEVPSLLPPWVRYVHTPLPQTQMPYSRSWAFNVGAELARGSLLILHDNDMLIPQDYASQMIERQGEGYEVINLKRFVFYLAKNHSERIMKSGAIFFDTAPETVVQNLEAGGSFAITREAYFAIGGFDESFVGWGGEDNEFWERAQTRSLWSYGYMPIIHLWHENSPDKSLGEDAPAKRRYWELSSVPPADRIRNLIERQTAQTF